MPADSPCQLLRPPVRMAPTRSIAPTCRAASKSTDRSARFENDVKLQTGAGRPRLPAAAIRRRRHLTLTPMMVTDIEGPYANGNPPPPLSPGVYPSHAQAEQVESIVGIHHAQAAYFRGQVAAMG